MGAGGLFVLSGLAQGPGFGWWFAAVHLFVLGHVVLLITAVSLRLVPRSLNADVSRTAVYLLASLATTGAILVPVGMLETSPFSAARLTIFAAPEAAFAILFVSVLVVLVSRARTPRAEASLHLTSLTFFLIGGSIGLWMVFEGNYTPVVAHALAGVLGFVGLTILFMWFSMVAPFLRISHAWTRWMLWTLSGIWIGGVLVAIMGGIQDWFGTGWFLSLSGALLLGVVIVWGAGTIPVLFPGLNPLPGLTSEKIRVIRDRWKNR